LYGAVSTWAGLLVVIEGIDGAGKSTLARGIAERVIEAGHDVVRTREPTDGPFGRRIRALAASARTRVPADEEWRLFHEDRRIHVEEVVKPALEAGKIVVQDRSWPSTVAYQGERGLDRGMLEKAERRIAPDPDLLFVVDLPPDVALARIEATRGRADDFEGGESLRRLRDVFLGFPGAIVLDGELPADELVARACARVREALAAKAV
jgi:dTMP kinase